MVVGAVDNASSEIHDFEPRLTLHHSPCPDPHQGTQEPPHIGRGKASRCSADFDKNTLKHLGRSTTPKVRKLMSRLKSSDQPSYYEHWKALLYWHARTRFLAIQVFCQLCSILGEARSCRRRVQAGIFLHCRRRPLRRGEGGLRVFQPTSRWAILHDCFRVSLPSAPALISVDEVYNTPRR